MKRIVIIGGGISGLAAAHHLWELRREADVRFEITLLEAKERWGGVIETVDRDGFLFEGGPDAFLSEKPWARELCQRLGLERELLETQEGSRQSFIVRGKRLLPVPKGFYLMAPARLGVLVRTPLLSWPGKLRVALEPFIPVRPGEGDESVASFIRRRLGRETLERIGQPMIGGIYTADVEALSLQATFPRFREMERRFGSVLKGLGANGGGEEASGPRYHLFLTLRQGMEKLVEALVTRLGEIDLRSSAPVVRIEKGGRWKIHLASGESLEADAFCLALPAPSARRLLVPLASEISELLERVPYESVATVNLAYRKEELTRGLEGSGFVVPALEKRKLIGCTFTSNKFSGRAPDDSVLLRAFVGGALQQEVFQLDDSALEETVRAELREILGITAPPQSISIHRFPESMPQYRVGHLSLVQAIEERLKRRPGLFLTGNAYRGIGIPDCVHHAGETAEKMFSFLK